MKNSFTNYKITKKENFVKSQRKRTPKGRTRPGKDSAKKEKNPTTTKKKKGKQERQVKGTRMVFVCKTENAVLRCKLFFFSIFCGF